MTSIKGYIRIKYESAGDILYTTDLDTLRSFGLERDPEFEDLTVVEEGTILNIPEVGKVKVTSMYTYFHDKDEKIGSAGINLYGRGENYPFNFVITYYVEKL